MTLRSIAELPFERRDPETLLGIVRGRTAPDLDYAGYGWSIAQRLVLEDAQGQQTLRDVFVVAIHSADVQPDPPAPIDLDFEVEGQSYLVTLPRFLEVIGPRLPIEGRDVVLVLCNPREVEIAVPEGWAPRVHFAHGDVIAWLDTLPDGEQLRLCASRWRTVAAQGNREEP